MEITISYILEIEVQDKRHVGLSSTNMEKEALRNALTRLKEVLDVVEIATDASSSVKKLIGKWIPFISTVLCTLVHKIVLRFSHKRGHDAGATAATFCSNNILCCLHIMGRVAKNMEIKFKSVEAIEELLASEGTTSSKTFSRGG